MDAFTRRLIVCTSTKLYLQARPTATAALSAVDDDAEEALGPAVAAVGPAPAALSVLARQSF